MIDSSTILRCENLTKRYGRTVGIEGLDLEIRRGEVFGFLGPNGAGKTTTIRLALGHLRPTSGTIALFSAPLTWGDWRHRARLGFLSGDLSLPRALTGRRLLRHLAKFHERIDWEWVGALTERFEFNPTNPIRDLSRGNQQKLGLIQALMHRPELIILDEPTTALDPLVQRSLLTLLRDLAGEGAAVFFSSHHLDEVEKVCDRVGIVRRGRLVALESVEELRRHRVTRVEVTLRGEREIGPLADIPGVREVTCDGNRVTLMHEGDAGPLLRALADLDPADLVWQPAELEDHFFTHFREGAQ